jgi:hypothetical protein
MKKAGEWAGNGTDGGGADSDGKDNGSGIGGGGGGKSEGGGELGKLMMVVMVAAVACALLLPLLWSLWRRLCPSGEMHCLYSTNFWGWLLTVCTMVGIAMWGCYKGSLRVSFLAMTYLDPSLQSWAHAEPHQGHPCSIRPALGLPASAHIQQLNKTSAALRRIVEVSGVLTVKELER